MQYFHKLVSNKHFFQMNKKYQIKVYNLFNKII